MPTSFLRRGMLSNSHIRVMAGSQMNRENFVPSCPLIKLPSWDRGSTQVARRSRDVGRDRRSLYCCPADLDVNPLTESKDGFNHF